MKNFNFTSQVCTSTEQSKRLLDLGLKSETADMCIDLYYEDEPFVVHNNKTDYSKQIEFVPAWSLHRLIEMCNKTQFGMTIGIHNEEVTVDGDLFEVYDNTYDNLISIIEWLIERGHFNKEYLK